MYGDSYMDSARRGRRPTRQHARRWRQPWFVVHALAALLLAASTLTARPAQAADSVNIPELIGRDGVRLVAVEFYANWCKPCMASMPRWAELKKRYYDKGLRVVVVNTQDPDGACRALPFNPDEMVCDLDGRVANGFGVAGKLPSAFLWSWQGNLLVKKGHIDAIEREVERYLDKAPRVVMQPGKGVDARVLAAVREKLQDEGKIIVLAGAEERRALAAAKKEQLSARFDSKKACEPGAEVPANALLKVDKVGTGASAILYLQVLDLQTGCAQRSASAPWNDKRADRMARDAVAKLLGKLRRGRVEMPRGGPGASAWEATLGTAAPPAIDWSAGGEALHVVTFRSKPKGATVALDDTGLCETPCARSVPAGRHQLAMSLAGHVTRRGRVDVSADQTVSWSLERNIAHLEITSEPSGQPITIDRKPTGEVTPRAFELPPGQHVVSVGEARCVVPHERRFQLKRGQRETFVAKPAVRPAGLQVLSTDRSGNAVRADVYADIGGGSTKKVGQTLSAITLPLCAKDIEVRSSKHGAARVDVTLREKQLVKASLKLGAGITWVRIEGGTFQMGSNNGDDDEKPVHKVTLSSYELAKTETTVAQYAACVAAGKCRAAETGGYFNADKSDRGDHPINGVSWDDATAFCGWAGGRLPTEAEWEYAARGRGRAVKYPWGNAHASCNYAVMHDGGGGCGKKRTWPVCSKPAGNTPQGLCDMSGNVYEWVSDWYAKSYRGAGSKNPKGVSHGKYRVYRGGSWDIFGNVLRAANRSGVTPEDRGGSLGFRCARTP